MRQRTTFVKKSTLSQRKKAQIFVPSAPHYPSKNHVSHKPQNPKFSLRQRATFLKKMMFHNEKQVPNFSAPRFVFTTKKTQLCSSGPTHVFTTKNNPKFVCVSAPLSLRKSCFHKETRSHFCVPAPHLKKIMCHTTQKIPNF